MDHAASCPSALSDPGRFGRRGGVDRAGCELGCTARGCDGGGLTFSFEGSTVAAGAACGGEAPSGGGVSVGGGQWGRGTVANVAGGTGVVRGRMGRARLNICSGVVGSRRLSSSFPKKNKATHDCERLRARGRV